MCNCVPEPVIVHDENVTQPGMREYQLLSEDIHFLEGPKPDRLPGWSRPFQVYLAESRGMSNCTLALAGM